MLAISQEFCHRVSFSGLNFHGPSVALREANMRPLQVLLGCVGAFAGSAVCAQTISFLPPVSASTGGAGGGSSICGTCLATADFNGDGNLDIVYSASVDAPF